MIQTSLSSQTRGARSSRRSKCEDITTAYSKCRGGSPRARKDGQTDVWLLAIVEECVGGHQIASQRSSRVVTAHHLLLTAIALTIHLELVSVARASFTNGRNHCLALKLFCQQEKV